MFFWCLARPEQTPRGRSPSFPNMAPHKLRRINNVYRFWHLYFPSLKSYLFDRPRLQVQKKKVIKIACPQTLPADSPEHLPISNIELDTAPPTGPKNNNELRWSLFFAGRNGILKRIEEGRPDHCSRAPRGCTSCHANALLFRTCDHEAAFGTPKHATNSFRVLECLRGSTYKESSTRKGRRIPNLLYERPARLVPKVCLVVQGSLKVKSYMKPKPVVAQQSV